MYPGCLLAISGRPAACLLFLADQRQRYYSIMSACARASSSFATRPRPHHVMTKYWRNLIWRCVHNPPNRQIKFPAKFSGHTVGHACIYGPSLSVPKLTDVHNVMLLRPLKYQCACVCVCVCVCVCACVCVSVCMCVCVCAECVHVFVVI